MYQAGRGEVRQGGRSRSPCCRWCRSSIAKSSQQAFVAPQSSHVDGQAVDPGRRLDIGIPGRSQDRQVREPQNPMQTSNRIRPLPGARTRSTKFSRMRRTISTLPTSATAPSAASTPKDRRILVHPDPDRPLAGRAAARWTTKAACGSLKYAVDKRGRCSTLRPTVSRNGRCRPSGRLALSGQDRQERRPVDRRHGIGTASRGSTPKPATWWKYPLPANTNIRNLYIDNETTPVTVWFGNNHGGRYYKVGAAGLTSAFSIGLTLPLFIARLDPKSGLPDFGTLNDRNRKRPISNWQSSIHGGGYWIARSSRAMTATEAGQPLQQDRDSRAGIFLLRSTARVQLSLVNTVSYAIHIPQTGSCYYCRSP